MKLPDELACRETISKVISDIEAMAPDAGAFSTGAILVLKNTLDPPGPEAEKAELVFEAHYALPGSLRSRWHRDNAVSGFGGALQQAIRDFLAWVRGVDANRFRDRCDNYLWRVMVPEISRGFGDLADEMLNTVNEAIINYAEYSFKRWAWHRRVHVHVFKTDADLGYAIIRPSGTRLKAFDPLDLKTRPTEGDRELKKRGWGHTLLMERALFLSFDEAPKRRGMMIIVGNDPEAKASKEIPVEKRAPA